MADTKTCALCGVEKPLTEFNVDNSRPDGHQRRCRQCYRDTRRSPNRNPVRDDIQAPVSAPEFTLDGFREFCLTLRLEDGQPLVLEAFQERFLASVFDGASETTVLLQKKSGKSTCIAALSLYRLLCDPHGRIAIAAAARNQASYMFEQASTIVARSGLKDTFLVLPGRKVIRSREGSGEIVVLASDSSTADGWLGSWAVADEVGHWKSADMFVVLRGGVIARNGQMISISTASSDADSPLGVIRTNAYKLPVRRDLGCYHYRADEAGTVAFHEWSLTDEDDLDDVRVAKLVNPASWMTLAKLQALHDSPGIPAFHWARYHCGVWRQGPEDSAIRPEDWEALRESGIRIPAGSDIWLGLDLGWRTDATAIVPLWWESDTRRVLGAPVILTPPEDGSMLDDRLVVNAILSLARVYRVEAIVFDPAAGGQQLAQALEREHRLRFIEHSQMSAARSKSDVVLLEAIRRKEIVHDWSAEASAHVLNVVARDRPDGSFWFDRPKHGPRKPTDACVALSICHAVALAEETRPQSVVRGYGSYS